MKTVLDGERRVTLECAVSDRKQIGFRWTFNGRMVENTTRRHQIGSNLVFARILREYDTGEYVCIASNYTSGFTLKSPNIKLNVVCKLKLFFIFFCRIYIELLLKSLPSPCQTFRVVARGVCTWTDKSL